MSIDVAKDRLDRAQQELRAHEFKAAIADEKDLLEARVEVDKAVSEGNSVIAVMKATAAGDLRIACCSRHQVRHSSTLERRLVGDPGERNDATRTRHLVQATSGTNTSAVAAVDAN